MPGQSSCGFVHPPGAVRTKRASNRQQLLWVAFAWNDKTRSAQLIRVASYKSEQKLENQRKQRRYQKSFQNQTKRPPIHLVSKSAPPKSRRQKSVWHQQSWANEASYVLANCKWKYKARPRSSKRKLVRLWVATGSWLYVWLPWKTRRASSTSGAFYEVFSELAPVPSKVPFNWSRL